MEASIAVVGAGATGGFFGACLARAGLDVRFLARGRQLEALRSRGLRVESVDLGTIDLPKVVAADDPAKIGPADLVLLCVKSYDLDAALASLSPLLKADTLVLPILNGVEAAAKTAQVVGPGRVLGGVARIEAFVKEPGVVAHTSPGVRSITFGELDGSRTPRARRVLEVLKKGGFDVALSERIVAEVWEKFSFMCGFSGASAATRLPKGPLFEHTETKRLVQDAMKEVAAVARAKRIPVAADVVAKQMAFVEGRAWTFASSMMRDLVAGRRIEVEDLNGAAVRFGRESQVPVPVNGFLYACLQPYANGAPKAPGSPKAV